MNIHEADKLRTDLLNVVSWQIQALDISEELFNRSYNVFHPKYKHLNNIQLKLIIKQLIKQSGETLNGY